MCERPHIDSAGRRSVESGLHFERMPSTRGLASRPAAGVDGMLGRRFVRCGGCRLRFVPEKKKGRACPACGSKALSPSFEPFHLGLVLLVLAAGAGALELRASPSAEPPPRRTARVAVRQIAAAAEAGPRRGKTVTLKRGDVVEVRDRDGEVLLVQDAGGNQVRVKAKQLELR